MIDLAVISGTGFYDFPGLEEQIDQTIDTKFGDASVRRGVIDGKKVAFIARHGRKHSILPNRINQQQFNSTMPIARNGMTKQSHMKEEKG